MSKKKHIGLKLVLVLSIFLLLTGCTTQLKNDKGKVVKDPTTGQTLTKNILCQPTEKTSVDLYNKNKVKVDKLPKCEDMKINSGHYEGLWNSFFVKPLAFALIKIGTVVKNYAISLIIITLIIRMIVFPLTLNMARQAKVMKDAQPELTKLQKKYAGKEQTQENMMKQNQEMMAIYKKYNINPALGCIFAFIQLPLFIAFFEAIQRTPAIYEDSFLGMHLGTTASVGLSSATFYSYLILVILIGVTTYLSFKMNQTDMSTNPTMKYMPIMMTVMIIFMGFVMPAGLGIYWVTSNIFTIVQNAIVGRSKKDERA
ncbi:MAG: YidC/Oxa1 family membrane protein insertase [Bacilli bacterium]|nr:YidC/Oxa1 family membrane protein insertase [Bacilli bacterium]